jgi:hypothetical protein
MSYPVIFGIPALAAVFALATLSPAMAQRDVTPDGLPLREGNVYDHQSHQPTQAEVRAARQGAGITSPSSDDASVGEVEDEVRELLRQTDQLDKQSEQDDDR